MPTGPKGEKRPADVKARAVMIAKIATGEIEEKGGVARAGKITPERRVEIAKNASRARWKR